MPPGSSSAPAARTPFRALAVGAALFLAYQAPEALGQRLAGSATLHAVLALSVLPIAWLLSRWLEPRGWAAYALEPRPRALAWLLMGMAAAWIAKGAALALGLRLGVYAAPQAFHLGRLPAALPWLLLATAVPSLSEDLLTRGFWFRQGPARRGAAFLALSTAVYVLNHVWRLREGPAEWLMLAAFGLAYASALLRTGSLWPAFGLHWGWNLANALLDAGWGFDTVDPGASRLLSAGAHLLLAALAAVLPAGPQDGASKPSP